MAGLPGPVADEREALLAFLAQQRYTLRLTAYGLSDEAASATPSASALSVGGLIKHVSAMEQQWMEIVQGRYDGAGGGDADYETNFRLQPGETMAGVLARYAEVAAETDAIVAGISDLGQPVPVPQGVPVVPRRRGGLVGPVGAAPPHRGDRPPQRPRRHRARVGGRGHRLPAHGGRRGLAGEPLDAALGAQRRRLTARQPSPPAFRRPASPRGTGAAGAPRSGWAVFRFVDRDHPGPAFEGELVVFDPPHALEFWWGTDLLRFTIRPEGDGCVLELSDTFDELGKAARDASGWHACLDDLGHHLDGVVPPSTTSERWAEVHPVYGERFGPAALTIGPPPGL